MTKQERISHPAPGERLSDAELEQVAGGKPITGGSGDDNVYGNDGDDHLYGGSGNDLMTGEATTPCTGKQGTMTYGAVKATTPSGGE